MTKFGNVPTVLFNVKFDSAAEAWYYPILLERLEAGEIKDLHLQPRYELLPAFERDGKRIAATFYQADFDFLEGDARIVLEVKGHETAVWRLKKKMFLHKYPNLVLRVVRV